MGPLCGAERQNLRSWAPRWRTEGRDQNSDEKLCRTLTEATRPRQGLESRREGENQGRRELEAAYLGHARGAAMFVFTSVVTTLVSVLPLNHTGLPTNFLASPVSQAPACKYVLAGSSVSKGFGARDVVRFRHCM